ncbi:unnamed protein product [Meganyctiphanes norvegica]|uniref:Failed axon connections homolog n=1 Tax=Meganyctiphanes norvegica TaxID=48144 RepID=A0AAV2QAJ1_MEGNR
MFFIFNVIKLGLLCLYNPKKVVDEVIRLLEFMHTSVRYNVRVVQYGTCLVVLTTGAVIVYERRNRSKQRLAWNSVGRDVVLVHGDPRGVFTPSTSPFVLKLETYLRLAEIPYQYESTSPFGPKGKMPWITLNSSDMGDSQLIIEHLGTHFSIDLNRHLPEDQQAVAKAFVIMMEEHLAWGLRIYRYRVDACKGLLQCVGQMPLWMRLGIPIMRRRVVSACHAQGIGRHTDQEVEDIVRKDLLALSTYLGDKPFLLGDEPSEVDCTMFGFMAQILWNYPGSPYEKLLNDEFVNIKAYVLRIKERLWPDWDSCLSEK